MSVSSSIAASIDALKRNPVLFVAALVVALVNCVALGVQATAPLERVGLLSAGASFVVQLLTLFFVGGAYAMASEGLRGKTSLRTLVVEGKANYLPLLGATVLVAILSMVTFFVVAVVGVVAVIGASVPLGGGGGVPAFAVLLAGLYLFAFLPLFFFQFYSPAVVVSDLGVVEAFKRSVGLVRRNLVSTLGYMTISAIVGAVAGVAGIVVVVVGELYGGTAGTEPLLPEVGVAVLVPAVVAVVAVTTVVSAFGVAYQVTFYDDRLASLA